MAQWLQKFAMMQLFGGEQSYLLARYLSGNEEFLLFASLWLDFELFASVLNDSGCFCLIWYGQFCLQPFCFLTTFLLTDKLSVNWVAN